MCNNTCRYRYKWSFHLLQGHKSAPERGFMAALFPRICCFYSNKGSSEEVFFHICQISNIFFLK